jgi:hypothetical protein
LRLTPGAQALVQFSIMLGEDLRGEQAGVRGAALPMASVPTGIPRGI